MASGTVGVVVMAGGGVVEPPPVFGREFVLWLRKATEDRWGRLEDADVSDQRLFWPRWRRGTRWTGGLDDAAIIEVERRYETQFSPQHRMFLQVLHSTTPWRYSPDYSGGRTHPGTTAFPGFYDWQREEAQIRSASRSAVDGVVRDTLADSFWGDSWGPCPDAKDDRRDGLAELMAAAPRLLPIFGHRFVVDHGTAPVLSIVGTDVVVYGTDLRNYLLRELHQVLGIPRPPLGPTSTEIPFWGDLLHAQN